MAEGRLLVMLKKQESKNQETRVKNQDELKMINVKVKIG